MTEAVFILSSQGTDAKSVPSSKVMRLRERIDLRVKSIGSVDAVGSFSSAGRQLLPTSDFIVDIGWTLGRYFLNNVHWRPVVTTHTLVMATQHALRGPQGKDDVAAVRAVVVTADAVPLGRCQSVEGHRGRRLALRDSAPPTAAEPPEHNQGDRDDQE